jgi:uncharacterized membrane-anchored protein YitT (DUF2179 family)
MRSFYKRFGWIPTTILGSLLFSLGFDLFLLPHELNAGGVSGLSMVIHKLIPFVSVGVIQIIINLPLFLFGGLKIGKKFFVGSLLGMATSSLFIDLFAALPVPQTEPLLGLIYGSLLCGAGIGVVFASGTSTGGSDILVRLLKLRLRNVPVGQICLCIDLAVAVLTGLVFGDVTKTLYTGVTVFLTTKIMDAVIYRFDYSKVALIVTAKYEEVAKTVGEKLSRGTTYLYGEGAYTGKQTKVVLTAIKRQQLAELKELVTDIDPNAFIILQEAHQVLGDGFTRYSKNSL